LKNACLCPYSSIGIEENFMTALGIMFQREYPPEELVAFTKAVEALGMDELWVVEDCFYAGGIAQAATALAYSERMQIGLGIMPAVARNPAFTALEIASLARIAPKRFRAGIGHGVTGWMEQIGALPKSQLAALEETTLAVKGILSGANYSLDGKWTNLRDVKLYHPLSSIPPVYLGVRREKSLQLSGRVADGTILAEGSSPAYIQWAKEQIALGQQNDEKHHISVYIYWSMDDDVAVAEGRVRERLAANMASGRKDMYQEAMGITDAVQEMLKEGGIDYLRDNMPEGWMREMALYGSYEACARTIEKLVAAGTDSILLVPLMHKDIAVSRYLPELLRHLGR
jgi:alkanesulfonate monooxygenase SsuD/methylene tetrahydromethanopterin reductase-like flavin-dependent oxidoreductase (luciferase family)